MQTTLGPGAGFITSWFLYRAFKVLYTISVIDIFTPIHTFVFYLTFTHNLEFVSCLKILGMQAGGAREPGNFRFPSAHLSQRHPSAFMVESQCSARSFDVLQYGYYYEWEICSTISGLFPVGCLPFRVILHIIVKNIITISCCRIMHAIYLPFSFLL